MRRADGHEQAAAQVSLGDNVPIAQHEGSPQQLKSSRIKRLPAGFSHEQGPTRIGVPPEPAANCLQRLRTAVIFAKN
jgi:hypothetical protein